MTSSMANLLSLLAVAVSILIGIVNLDHPAVNEFLVKTAFGKFKDGVFCMQFKDNGEVLRFGETDKYTECDNTMVVNDRANTFKGLVQGSIGIGTSYFNGHWDAAPDSDLGDLFSHLLWNIKTKDGYLMGAIFRFLRIFDWQEYLERIGLTKSKSADKEHIQYHYNLTKMYEYMLDSNMVYTCALWTEDTTNLYEAQMNKVDVLLGKMRINMEHGLRGGNVLDIGSGWGHLVSYIHNQSTDDANPFNVTGISITDDQVRYSMDRWNGDKNNRTSPYYLNMDFRDLHKVYGDNFFDSIVSVGVISHIHAKRMDEFFDIMYKILKPGGSVFIQGVTATQALNVPFEDDHFAKKSKLCKGYNFIGKYIFPGGCVILGDWIMEWSHKHGFLNLHREYIGHHYSKTLRQWRSNLMKHKKEIMRKDILDGAEWFYRMYLIYLANCEAAFRTGAVEKGHYLFYKPVIPDDGKSKIPATRKYTLYDKHIHFPALNKPLGKQ